MHFAKKGVGISWDHLGNWIIALCVLVIVLLIMAVAFGAVDLDFIRNVRFG